MVISARPQSPPKDPTEQRVRAFEQRYGRQATNLAAHGAFPLTLTTDVVYCLRETFLPDCPWYAAADVLLSGLCTPAGHDLYEMDAATRRYLLRYLRDQFGEGRIAELERFMVAYLRHRLTGDHPDDRALLLGEKPHWTALACLQPGEAYDEIRQTLEQLALQTPDPTDRFRLAALVESYGDFLADRDYQPMLLEWADRVAEGKPIDATAAAAEQLQTWGFNVSWVEFEVATVAFGVEAAPPEADELISFEFETPVVDASGSEIQRVAGAASYFIEYINASRLGLQGQAAVRAIETQQRRISGRLATLEQLLRTVSIQLVQTLGDSQAQHLKEQQEQIEQEIQETANVYQDLDTRIEKLRANGAVSLNMLAIPSGTFIMGSPENEPGHYGDEGPQQRVKVSPFFISQTPVTQAQWRAVAALPQQERKLSPDPAHFKGDDRPVEQVSWYDAVEFCARLSKHTGRTYRLPTEAEWEYACRADTTTPFYFGGTITTELANYDGSVFLNEPKAKSWGETTPVGQFPPNAFGLYDLHGNVWEWCLDYWHENYDRAPTDGSAWLTENEKAGRVIRGGSWVVNPRYCRSAYRSSLNPVNRFNVNGFRVICEARGL